MDELSLEVSDGCLSDVVTLYDGRTEDSDILSSYCSDDTSVISSTGPNVLVVFQSDDSINTGGFTLSWTFDGDDQGRFSDL